MTPCPVNKVRPLAVEQITDVSDGTSFKTPEKPVKEGSILDVKAAEMDKTISVNPGAKDTINNKFADVINRTAKVEGPENMQEWWKIFAVFLDCLLFAMNIVAILVILIVFSHYSQE